MAKTTVKTTKPTTKKVIDLSRKGNSDIRALELQLESMMERLEQGYNALDSKLNAIAGQLNLITRKLDQE